jgi:hypothetical protein
MGVTHPVAWDFQDLEAMAEAVWGTAAGVPGAELLAAPKTVEFVADD